MIADGTTLGDNVVVGPNSFVGASPFDYSISSEREKSESDRFHAVEISDGVEIGANVVIPERCE